MPISNNCQTDMKYVIRTWNKSDLRKTWNGTRQHRYWQISKQEQISVCKKGAER